MKQRRTSKFNPRQYMLERDFEIYYYSDAHFHSVGSHTHDYYEFYFFEEGDVLMEIGKQAYPLKKGDLLVVPPGVPHCANVVDDGQPYRRFVFWIGLDYLGDLIRQAEEYGLLADRARRERAYLYHFDLLTFNNVRMKLFSLLDELHTDRFGKSEQLRLELRSLLLLVNRLAFEQTETRTLRDEKNKYAQISAYVDEHLSEDLSVEKIAGEFFLSKSYVSHLFKENTGMSIYQYLIKKRLAAICTAIQSGVSIAEASLLYGFRDYSGFYRAFQKEFGISPSAYRELHKR